MEEEFRGYGVGEGLGGGWVGIEVGLWSLEWTLGVDLWGGGEIFSTLRVLRLDEYLNDKLKLPSLEEK